MARPITWKNVNNQVATPDFSAASEIMGRAQQNFNQAFSGANELMAKRAGIEQDNQEAMVSNQTDQFEKALRDRYKNPEELQAARESGEVQSLRDQFGQYGLDSERTDAGAIDGLVTGMQQRQNQQYQYDESQRKQADQPVIAELQSMRNSITSEGGIESINQNIAGYRDEVARRVEAGELSQQAGASLMSDVNEYQNVLEADFRGDRTAGRKEDEYQRQKASEQAIKDAQTSQMKNYREYDERANQFLGEVGNLLGLSPGQATDPNQVERALQTASPEVREQYSQLRQQGIGLQDPRQNDANRVQENYQRFLETMGPDEAWAAAQALDQRGVEMEALGARAQGQLSSAKQNRDKALARNDFWKAEQSAESPAEIMLAITQQAQSKKDGLWSNWIENNQQELSDFITKAAGGKYEIDGVEVPLPRAVIETAVLNSDPGWITDDNPNDQLKKILKQMDLGDQLDQYRTETRGVKNLEARLKANGLGRPSGRNAQQTLQALPDGGLISESVRFEDKPERQFSTENAENRAPSVDAPASVIKKLDSLQEAIEARSNNSTRQSRDNRREKLKELVRLLPDEALLNGSEYLPKGSTAAAAEIMRRGIQRKEASR